MKLLYEIIHPTAAGRDEGDGVFYFGGVHGTSGLEYLGISPVFLLGVGFSVLCHMYSPFLTNPYEFQCITFS